MKISVRQYTSAFFQAAENSNKLEEATNELSGLNQNAIMLRNFLANPNVKVTKKKELLEESGVSPVVTNFLLVLEKNNDLAHLDFIVSRLKELLNKKSNIAEVEIEVPEKLDENKIAGIKNKLEAKLNKRVILKTRVNKEILGGIIIKIGDNLIDNSLTGKLSKLREALIV